MFIKDVNSLSSGKKMMLASSVAFIILIYATSIFFAVDALYINKDSAQQNHKARMNPTEGEPGKTKPDALPDEGHFATVTVGTYIDNIDAFSIRDSKWSANLYVWFRWTGQKSLDPGKNFVIVDGNITKKELMDDYHGDNDVHYQKYRIAAHFIKYFDTMRAPLESHMLNVYIEDGARDGTMLRYVADPTSNISSRAKIPGYTILKVSNVVKNHTYKSAYGDPRRAADARATFTQYIAGVSIQRSGFGVYAKIFVSLYAALVLALSNFFVKPSDVGPRFSLPSAAFFGAVANSYVANSILPPSGSFGLVDFVAAFGMGTIFLTIALSLISNYIFVKKEDKTLALVLDRSMFFVVGIACGTANIILPWVAFE